MSLVLLRKHGRGFRLYANGECVGHVVFQGCDINGRATLVIDVDPRFVVLRDEVQMKNPVNPPVVTKVRS